MDIKWLTDCTYLLFNRKVVNGNDGTPPRMDIDTVYNEIKLIDGNRFTVASTLKAFSYTTEAIMVKVDSSLLYSNISELPKFKEYNGGRYGGTHIDNNYSIASARKSTNKTQYVLAFEETFSINQTTKFLLLDAVGFKMYTNQKLATWNCRYADRYDKEVVAVYTSTDDNQEARIIQAWRMNRKTLKIENLEIRNVKFKVADKNLLFWLK
jgi:hypothetical protein